MDLPLDHLPEVYRSALTRGNVKSVHDLLFTPSQDLSKKCRLPPMEINRLTEKVLQTVSKDHKSPLALHEACTNNAITSGDPHLDLILDGGLQTSALWEVTGESAAGKTQFALQMSLTVQLPITQGGLEGSCCYLTTKSELQTKRLLEIMEKHPATQDSACTLDDIHTLKVPDVQRLLYVLNETIPQLIHQLEDDRNRKPVRLVIVDAITELFHQGGRTSSDSLRERSRNITDISTALHKLASRYSVAVLVLNEVIDSVVRGSHNLDGQGGDVTYQEQSAHFKSAEGYPHKEAGLGLTWANQINARIMLSRTHRRRHLSHEELTRSKKRSRLEVPASPLQDTKELSEPTLIRNLSVVFGSTISPRCLDYIVTEAGIVALPGDYAPETNSSQRNAPSANSTPQLNPPIAEASPSLDILGHDEDILAGGDVPALDRTLDGETTEDEYDALWPADERFFSDLDYSTLGEP